VATLCERGSQPRAHKRISAPVQPGNSGGPLFDWKGNVVGVVVAKLNALGDISRNVNFAIKASVVTAFLDAQRMTVSVDAPGYALDTLSTPDIAARAQALAVQVICI
jgi:serine protease Do